MEISLLFIALFLLILIPFVKEGFAGEYKPDMFSSNEIPCCRSSCVKQGGLSTNESQ